MIEFKSAGVLGFLVLLGVLRTGTSIRCFECVSRLGPGETDACWSGNGNQLRRVRCMGPSVCAAYFHESMEPGSMPSYYITRGCQALRYGSTCEDIFHHLRNNKQILPGRHTCATCSTDLCNSSTNVKLSFILIFFILVSSFVNYIS